MTSPVFETKGSSADTPIPPMTPIKLDAATDAGLLLPVVEGDVTLTSDLEGLQSNEQRRVLDIVAQVQKCGLKGVLSFPQLVVCGDQSSGKSSVLEALTGVPFPRSDNLCTRYATEISLRRGNADALTIRVIPDENRPQHERDFINAFTESITNFDDLPRVMKLATKQMGIDEDLTTATARRAFARDVLSITIEGPNRPQLTLVDIPGLIATNTRGITKEDVALVTSITDHYIRNPRTICLAVISATNDYANQKILTKVRNVDPEGKRTLGIITKPDGLAANSGSEKAYIELARNRDVVFELGWHVLKNRKFEESHFSLMERNAAEDTFLNTSNFKVLPREHRGIDELRKRLSLLLFQHVKSELPKLRKDLDTTLRESQSQLSQLGIGRSSPAECKAYLSQFSQEYWAICKDAVNGHYEDEYFLRDIDRTFNLASDSTIRRTRAVVQSLNSKFATHVEAHGHKFEIQSEEVPLIENGEEEEDNEVESGELDERSDEDQEEGSTLELRVDESNPQELTHAEALDWVRQVLVRSRGKELIGNFNPLLIGELLREQAGKWKDMATEHIEDVSRVCTRFLKLLLHDRCLEDVEDRLWTSHIEDVLEERKKNAYKELDKIISEVQSHPINYNHYYTETIANSRQARLKLEVAKSVKDASSVKQIPGGRFGYRDVDPDTVVKLLSEKHEANMESFSCSEALDCLLAIYQVSQKVFVANITTQVIERHIVRGLETIFAPVVVNALSDQAVEAVASEPLATRRKREFLKDRIEKLEAGQKIFKNVMGGGRTR